MKGVEGLPFIRALVIILIVIGIALYFAGVAKGGVDWESLLKGFQPQLGEASDTSYQLIDSPVLPEEQEIDKIASEGLPFAYSSEIGCWIAKTIKKDLDLRALEASFHEEDLDCAHVTCLVNYTAPVKIGQDPVFPPGIIEDYEDADCKLCEPLLDEVCINYNLNNSLFQDTSRPICGDWYFSRGNVDNKKIDFGNEIDYENTTHNNWPDDKEYFCKKGNEDRIYMWYADRSTSAEIYKDLDHRGDEDTYELTPIQDGVTPYVVYVFYRKDHHDLSIWFTRIPIQLEKELNGDQVLDIIKNTFCKNGDCGGDGIPSDVFRNNPMGLFDYVKAREVLDYNVTLTTQLDLADITKALDFKSKEINERGSETSYIITESKFRSCSNLENCLQPQLKQKTIKKHCESRANANEYIRNKQNIFLIVSDASSPNDILQPGKYRFVIRKWFNNYDQWWEWVDWKWTPVCKARWEKSIIIYKYSEEEVGGGEQCDSDADCPSERKFCIKAQGMTVGECYECGRPTDCGTDYCSGDTFYNYYCVDFKCGLNIRDCRDRGYVCSEANGVPDCRPSGGCLEDADCVPSKYCNDVLGICEFKRGCGTDEDCGENYCEGNIAVNPYCKDYNGFSICSEGDVFEDPWRRTDCTDFGRVCADGYCVSP